MDYKFEILENDFDIEMNFKDIMVFFVLNGNVKLDYNKSSKIFKQNDLFVIRPFSLPVIINNEDAKVIVLTIDQLSFNRFSLYNLNDYNIKHDEVEGLVKKEFLKTIMSIYENDLFSSNIHIIKLINYINIGNYGENTMECHNELVIDVMGYVNEHYKEPLSVTQIADQFYVNSSYLSRLFSETLNIPLSSYIRKVKMYYLAVDIMVLNSDKGLWKKYGYNSYSTYLQNFKYIFALSPSEFIKKYKQKHITKNEISCDIYKSIEKSLNQIELIES